MKEFYDHQAEKHHDDEGANDDDDSNSTILEPISDCIVSSRNEDLSSSAGRRKEDMCNTYTATQTKIITCTTILNEERRAT